jgi:hypothetical protein
MVPNNDFYIVSRVAIFFDAVIIVATGLKVVTLFDTVRQSCIAPSPKKRVWINHDQMQLSTDAIHTTLPIQNQ